MSSESKNSNLSNGFEQSNDDHELIDSNDMERIIADVRNVVKIFRKSPLKNEIFRVMF